VAEAVLAAVRACLENVVRHSGATVAEVELISDNRQVTVMVTDRGEGFDPSVVPADRLGLRSSVAERMAAVGGTAKVFSAPGQGTSVILSAPVSQVVET
jgi:signal transduction histidine kinase